MKKLDVQVLLKNKASVNNPKWDSCWCIQW